MSTISVSSEDEDDVITFYSHSVSQARTNYSHPIIEIYKPPRHKDQQNWEDETDPVVDHTMEEDYNGGEKLLGSRNDSTTVLGVDLGNILAADGSRDPDIEEIPKAEDSRDLGKILAEDGSRDSDIEEIPKTEGSRDLGKILAEDGSRDSDIEEIPEVEDSSDAAKNFGNSIDNNATSKAGSAPKISIMQVLAIQLAKTMSSFDSSLKISTESCSITEEILTEDLHKIKTPKKLGTPKGSRNNPKTKGKEETPAMEINATDQNPSEKMETETCLDSIPGEANAVKDLLKNEKPKKRGRPKGWQKYSKTDRTTEETLEMEIIATDENQSEKMETETRLNSIPGEANAVKDLLKNEKPKKRGRPKGRRNNPITERTTKETSEMAITATDENPAEKVGNLISGEGHALGDLHNNKKPKKRGRAKGCRKYSKTAGTTEERPEIEIIAIDENPPEKMETETRLNSIPGKAHTVKDLLKNKKPRKQVRPKGCIKYSKTSESEIVFSNSNNKEVIKNKEINAEFKLEQTKMINSNFHRITDVIRCTNDEEKETKKVENNSRPEERPLSSKNNINPSPEKKKKSWKERLLQRETLDCDKLDHSTEFNCKRNSKCLDKTTFGPLEDSTGETSKRPKRKSKHQVSSSDNIFTSKTKRVYKKKAPTNKTSIKVGTIRIKPNEELFDTDKLHCAKEAVSNSVSDTIDTRITPVEQYVNEQNNGSNAESRPMDKRKSLPQVFLEPSNLEKKIIPNNIISTANFKKGVSICNDDLFRFLHYDRGDGVNERLINKSKDCKSIIKVDFENISFSRPNYVKCYNLAYDDNGEHICKSMGDILYLSLNEFSNLKIRLEKCRILTCDKLKQLEISSAMKYYRESFFQYKASFQKLFLNIYDKIFHDQMIAEHFKECRSVLLFTWLIKLYLRAAFLSPNFDVSLVDMRTYIIFGFLSNLHLQYPLLEKVFAKSASKFEVECWAVLDLMRDCYKEKGADLSFMNFPSKENSAGGMKDQGQAKKIHLSRQSFQKEFVSNLSGTIHSDTQTLHPKDPKGHFVEDLVNHNVNTSIPIEKMKNSKSNPERNGDYVQPKKIHPSGESFQEECMSNLSGTIHSNTETLDPKDPKEQFVENLSNDNGIVSFSIESKKAGGENKKVSLHNHSPPIVDKENDNHFTKIGPQSPRTTVICNPVNKNSIRTTDKPVNELVVRQRIENNYKEMCIWNPIRSHLQSDCSLSTRQVQHQNNSLRECMPHRVIISPYNDKGDAERNFSSRFVQSTNLDKDSGRAVAAKPTYCHDPRNSVNYTKYRGRVVDSYTRHGTNHRDDYRPRAHQTYPTATPHNGPNRYFDYPSSAAQAPCQILPRTSDQHLQETNYSNIHTGYKNYYQNHYIGPYQISSLHSARTTNPMPNSAGVTPSIRYSGLTREQVYMRHHQQTLYGSDLYRQYNSQNRSAETNYRGMSNSSQSYALDYYSVSNSPEFPNQSFPAASANGTSRAAPWRLSDGSRFNP